MGPFIAQQTSRLVPAPVLQRGPHGHGDGSDLFKVAVYPGLAVNVRLGHFPVIDAGIARRARIGQHKPLIQFVEIHRNARSSDPRRAQLKRTDPPIHRRIVILRAGGNPNHLRLNVLRDLAKLLQTVSGMGEAVERAADGNHHRRRSRDARTGGRLGVGLQRESGLRLEKPHCQRRQQVCRAGRLAQSLKRPIGLAEIQIPRAQVNLRSALSLNRTPCVAIHGKVNRYSSRVIEIQRPDVQRSAGQIHSAGRFANNLHGVKLHYTSGKYVQKTQLLPMQECASMPSDSGLVPGCEFCANDAFV